MQPGITFVLLFAVATAVALVARRFKVPYTVALVVAGLVLGAARAMTPPHLTKELLYAVFLPGLVFEASFHLDFRKFLENKVAIHALAIPGVVVAIGLTAVLLTPILQGMHAADGFGVRHALVFAAVIVATDPIAVVALFKSLGAPKRLAILVEGESLVNDGTAVVLFSVIVGIAGGGAFSASGAIVEFVRVFGMGVVTGAVIGFAIAAVIQRVDDPMVEITLTTIAAYGSFMAAEHLHFSGVMATVAAGMLCGNYAARTGMSATTRIAVESFWEYIAFALNSIIFLLIGFEVRFSDLLAAWQPILIAYLVVMLSRAAVTFAVSAALRRTRERISWSWTVVMTWGGLRGGLSMVLVLGLPLDFPFRDLLVRMTFGVVVLSILLQGLTMGTVLRKLGLIRGADDRLEYDAQAGAIRAARAGLAELDAMVAAGAVHPDVATKLRDEYTTRIAGAEDKVRSLRLERHELHQAEERTTRRHLLMTEKDTLVAAFRQGLIGEGALERHIAALDERLLALGAGDH